MVWIIIAILRALGLLDLMNSVLRDFHWSGVREAAGVLRILRSAGAAFFGGVDSQTLRAAVIAGDGWSLRYSSSAIRAFTPSRPPSARGEV